jgi:uncharacterized protein YfcZ (UPF0381/DUF406 family)
MLRNTTVKKILEEASSQDVKIKKIVQKLNEAEKHLTYCKKIARYIAEGCLIAYMVFSWISELFL